MRSKRARCRAGDIAIAVISVASVLAVWPGLYFYALATMPGA